VRLQSMLALTSFAGLLHLGLADAIFQWKVEGKQISESFLLRIKKVVAFLSVTGACIVLIQKSLTSQEKLAVLIITVVANQSAVKNAINNGSGRTQIQSRALLFEKALSSAVLLAIIFTGISLPTIWIPLTMVVGYMLLREEHQASADSGEVNFIAAIKTGFPLMVSNLTGAAQIPVIMLAMSHGQVPETARIYMLTASVCGAVLSYLSQYSIIVISDSSGSAKTFQNTIYKRLTLAVTVLLCVATLLVMQRPQGRMYSQLLTLFVISSVFWLIEMRSLILHAPWHRRNWSTTTIVVANVSGALALAIVYQFAVVLELGDTLRFAALLIVPSLIRNLILSQRAARQ
jgi:hypothetical protein